VLSRCLQFNLKRLDEAQIRGQIDARSWVRKASRPMRAVRQLARAADGSLRDGCRCSTRPSPTPAARGLDEPAVATMLGTVDRTRVRRCLRRWPTAMARAAA
jgi:DNA polymerase-3 subunit gamma/tau